jgi:hypothetical protein
MNIIKKFILNRRKGSVDKSLACHGFSDAEIEEKLRLRVSEFLQDIEQKELITINVGFSWKIEVDSKKGIIRLFHDEYKSAVDDMLDEIGVTTAEHDSKNN